MVEPTTLPMVSTKLGVPVKLPDVPGTYRLTVTLHDDTGLAFDAATQALLPTLLVRVTGEVDGAVLAPAATTVVPGTDATTLPVRVINLGTSPWGRRTRPFPARTPGCSQGHGHPRGSRRVALSRCQADRGPSHAPAGWSRAAGDGRADRRPV